MKRPISPTATEVDIGAALYQNTEAGDETNIATDGIDLEASSDEDAAFIAQSLATANRKSSNIKGRTVKKGGGFQAMGLNANLLKAITRKGFSVPTPIQRKTIPLLLEGQDVVGMARTGSGKTAAFVIPMIEKFKTHSPKVGARGLIMSPSRELALQTLKTVKELARGTDLRAVLLVGGDSLEEQFDFMSSNPDIVIATPGRFLHLQVEMSLDLSSMRYVVFDEADRLFEMGFAAQLTEILHALPAARQTLLFSATLPKSLVEFARAGLQEPELIRLDAESKISPDLQTAHFTLKTEEREGALIHLLQDVIRVPLGTPEASKGTKRKHAEDAKRAPTTHSTIIFVATKHHVEYLAALLRAVGWAVSHAYGSLDQTARKMQVENFRNGLTNLLVVTDVAARGIDIPVLANVINYDFPAQPKIFVHRVGRTARAGQTGWAYSLVRSSDAPYLLDLQLFLGKRLVVSDTHDQPYNFVDDIVAGAFVRKAMEACCELASKILDEDADLTALQNVAGKGEKLYLRTRNAASSESARRAKEITSASSWTAVHPLFRDSTTDTENARLRMLAQVGNFKPAETVFELGKKNTENEAANAVRKRRAIIEAKRTTKDSPEPESDHEEMEVIVKDNEKEADFRSSDFFMSYNPTATNMAEDRAYGVHSGGNSKGSFVSAARGVTMDLGNDEGGQARLGEPSRMRWDKKSRKYVQSANDTDGSKGKRFIRGESGQKIAASFRSGRFDAWKKKNRTGKLPRIGEMESARGQNEISSGKHYRHRGDKAPKDADKFRDNYHKQRQLVNKAKDERRGRFRDGVELKKGRPVELRSVDVMHKERVAKDRRREKNAGGKKGR